MNPSALSRLATHIIPHPITILANAQDSDALPSASRACYSCTGFMRADQFGVRILPTHSRDLYSVNGRSEIVNHRLIKSQTGLCC